MKLSNGLNTINDKMFRAVADKLEEQQRHEWNISGEDVRAALVWNHVIQGQLLNHERETMTVMQWLDKYPDTRSFLRERTPKERLLERMGPSVERKKELGLER